MKTNDVDLIQRILDGDQSAFTALVNKYQKSVHALVWRKIGDFHIAEEITQDVFLKVYKRLSTLKRPELFPGWLYVITTRHCTHMAPKEAIINDKVPECDAHNRTGGSYVMHNMRQHCSDEASIR